MLTVKQIREKMVQNNPLYKRVFDLLEKEIQSAAETGSWSCTASLTVNDENGIPMDRESLEDVEALLLPFFASLKEDYGFNARSKIVATASEKGNAIRNAIEISADWFPDSIQELFDDIDFEDDDDFDDDEDDLPF